LSPGGLVLPITLGGFLEYDLFKWRKALGLTQEGAAALLGVHRVTYTRWETGAQRPPNHIGMACLSLKQLMENRV
jgi:DNA-binding XRE family transcriptional regulator